VDYFVCTNSGFWQKSFAVPQACPVCEDFRHTPPDGPYEFLAQQEAAHVSQCNWSEEADGIFAFASSPSWGIGPRGYLISHPEGNVFWENTGYYSPGALDFIASRGGVQWLSASHPHAYAALWQLQQRFEPEVPIHVADLKWTNAFNVTYPFESRLEILPGLEIIPTGGHFDGHCVLYWPARKTLFAGDMLKFHYEAGTVTGISTHKGFNRRIPMSHGEIERYHAVVSPLEFDTVYTTFESAPCTRDDALRLFDAQLAGKPFFGPLSFQTGKGD
jgi:hypothetical protein